MKKALIAAVLLWALPVLAQRTTGELRLTVTDTSGLGLKSTVELVSEANDYRHTFTTDDQGNLDARRLPYGIYQVQIQAEGFAQLSESVEIRSALPVARRIRLKVASVSESVKVSASATLIDPYRAGSVDEMGLETIQNRLTALPGRSMQDLVNSEPGWLYEGNAVLHPRGSEYQTQFVVDGIPLTDNRSPSFGPEIEADDVESLDIYTAGIPAEFGRKMGGVVEVNTLKNEDPGFHGQLTLFGGTFDTAGINTQDQYTWNKNTFGLSASGNMTGHYLDPVVPENYSNNGTTGSFSLSYERELTQKDRLTLIVRHELARYAIPNELVQQNGAHLPNANNTVGCPPVPRSRAIVCSSPEDSSKQATTLKPWGASPTSTFFPPTRSLCFGECPAMTPLTFIPTLPPGPSMPPSTTTSKKSISMAASPFIMAGKNLRRVLNPMPSSCTKTPAT